MIKHVKERENMFKKIKPNNKIFMNQEFQKDKYKFNLIFKNLSSPELDMRLI